MHGVERARVNMNCYFSEAQQNSGTFEPEVVKSPARLRDNGYGNDKLVAILLSDNSIH
jgi:hypothetical protein